jgi:hypothetical protein
MASKRPCEQQPGVVDEMANAIVRQVKAQRIVVNKGPKYQCFIPCGEQLQKVLLWPAVVSEQRTYAMQVGFERPETQPRWRDVVHFSSAKAAAKAFVATVSSERYASRVELAGTYVTLLIIELYRDTLSPSPESVANAVESVEQLLISGGVHIAVSEAE